MSETTETEGDLPTGLSLVKEFEPTKNSRIYQYCSPTSFDGQIKSKSMWLCDLNLMNDYLEGAWGYRKFEKVAGELLDKIPKDFFDEVDEIIFDGSLNTHRLAACFSKCQKSSGKDGPRRL
jgi:hypothetical protein